MQQVPLAERSIGLRHTVRQEANRATSIDRPLQPGTNWISLVFSSKVGRKARVDCFFGTSGFVAIPLTACFLTLKRARYVHASTLTSLTHDHKRSHTRLNPFRRTDPIH